MEERRAENENNEEATSEAMAQIADTAYLVHDILGRFVEEQKKMAQPGWRSLPIPGVFQAVNFGGLTSAFESIAAELSSVSQGSIPSEASLSSRPARQFAAALREYRSALERAVRALAAVCAKLAQKANAPESYGLSEYRRDMNTFDRLEAEYKEMGRPLNEWLAK